MTQPNWIEQGYAELAVEIPAIIAGLRQVAEQRRREGRMDRVEKTEALIAVCEEMLEAVHDRHSPVITLN
ncbi:MAG: hypothetical protein WD904_10955 [Dehalococcoidia bacterium]